MQSWKKYEDQIFLKLHREFPNSEILKNQKIQGIYSKRIRQIDILIKGEICGKNIFGIIDCKNFSRKLDIKIIESFIGLLEDINANIGIIITNKGYTKGAKSRISNYSRDIRLDVVEFKKLEYYHLYMCDFCANEEGLNKGSIHWDVPESLANDVTDVIIYKGECSYCGEQYIMCKVCGEIIHIDVTIDEAECECGHVFSFKSEYIGQGMTENRIFLKS